MRRGILFAQTVAWQPDVISLQQGDELKAVMGLCVCVSGGVRVHQYIMGICVCTSPQDRQNIHHHSHIPINQMHVNMYKNEK